MFSKIMVEKEGISGLTVVEPKFGTVDYEDIIVGFFADSGRNEE